MKGRKGSPGQRRQKTPLAMKKGCFWLETPSVFPIWHLLARLTPCCSCLMLLIRSVSQPGSAWAPPPPAAAMLEMAVKLLSFSMVPQRTLEAQRKSVPQATSSTVRPRELW